MVQYEKLTHNGYDIQVQSAVCDDKGVNFRANYAKKTDLPNITFSDQPPSGGKHGDIWIQY